MEILIMGKIFARGWYKVAEGHSESIPMQALQAESEDLRFYGLYMFLYDKTVKTNGEISAKDLTFYCKTKAKLVDSQIASFLNCCIEHEILVANEGSTIYYLPEVKEYLQEAEEARLKRIENSRQGGLVSAQKRASLHDSESSDSQFQNAGHYMPYIPSRSNN